MTVFYKYLFDNELLKKQQIGEICDLIKLGEEPTTALIEKISGLKTDWWPGFLKKYISGEIYNVGRSAFIENPDGGWGIDNDDDIERVFAPDEVGQYPDLSAKRFRFYLNDSTMDESQKLLVAIEGDDGSDELSTLVFTDNGYSLEFLLKGMMVSWKFQI